MNKTITNALIVIFLMTAFTTVATAQTSSAAATQGEFFKKKYRIKGSWEIVESNGERILRLSKDFNTKNGPDLKIFLSPISAAEVNGDTATNDAVLLGELKKNKGAQEYLIPTDVDLDDYSTVLIHCESYGILWGGGSLQAS